MQTITKINSQVSTVSALLLKSRRLFYLLAIACNLAIANLAPVVTFAEPTSTYETYDSSFAPTPRALPSEPEVVTYAKNCMAELGIKDLSKLPQYFNCLEGETVQQMVDGKPMTSLQYDEKGRVKCDFPNWGQERCDNFTYLKTFTFNEQVKGYAICRQQGILNFLNKEQREEELKKALSDRSDNAIRQAFTALYGGDRPLALGLIITNSTTGKTCFFDSAQDYSRFVPMPWITKPIPNISFPKPAVLSSDPVFESKRWKRVASDVWLPLSKAQNCVACHSLPLITSRWITQFKTPPIAVQHDQRSIPYSWPYFSGKNSLTPLSINTTPVKNPITNALEEQNCTSCHRITGSYSFIGNNQAVANPTTRSYIELSTGARAMNAGLTTFTSTLPTSHWMPLNHGIKNVDAWKASYEHHVKKLQCCVEDPFKKGCAYQVMSEKNGPWYLGAKTPGCESATTPTPTPTTPPDKTPTATPTPQKSPTATATPLGTPPPPTPTPTGKTLSVNLKANPVAITRTASLQMRNDGLAGTCASYSCNNIIGGPTCQSCTYNFAELLTLTKTGNDGPLVWTGQLTVPPDFPTGTNYIQVQDVTTSYAVNGRADVSTYEFPETLAAPSNLKTFIKTASGTPITIQARCLANCPGNPNVWITLTNSGTSQLAEQSHSLKEINAKSTASAKGLTIYSYNLVRPGAVIEVQASARGSVGFIGASSVTPYLQSFGLLNPPSPTEGGPFVTTGNTSCTITPQQNNCTTLQSILSSSIQYSTFQELRSEDFDLYMRVY